MIDARWRDKDKPSLFRRLVCSSSSSFSTSNWTSNIHIHVFSTGRRSVISRLHEHLHMVARKGFNVDKTLSVLLYIFCFICVYLCCTHRCYTDEVMCPTNSFCITQLVAIVKHITCTAHIQVGNWCYVSNLNVNHSVTFLNGLTINDTIKSFNLLFLFEIRSKSILVWRKVSTVKLIWRSSWKPHSVSQWTPQRRRLWPRIKMMLVCAIIAPQGLARLRQMESFSLW